jgi:hypothetical protein
MPPTATRVSAKSAPQRSDHQPQLAVVEQQFGARHQRAEDLGVRQRGALGSALRLVQVEAEGLPGQQHHRAVGKGADAQFRPLQVGEDADRPAGGLLQRAQVFEPGAVVGVVAMAEIQPEHVDAGLEELANHFRVGAGRSAATDKAKLIGYHWVYPGIGYAERDGSAFKYVPAS